MPSKNQYDLVQNDDYDTRIPLHLEEAFQHGIVFQAKYIGTLDVAKPDSRMEIVHAMRKIRTQFKKTGIKKKKVTIEVSVNGVKVMLRKKKKKKEWTDDENPILIMHHPIYRIFYVSHDSQDLKIFSYIARQPKTDVFTCSVFKSNKKSQAMRVVRTVGQAFEVCHQISKVNPSLLQQQDEEQVSEIDVPSEKIINSGDSEQAITGNDSNSTLDASSDVTASPNRNRPLRLEINPSQQVNHTSRRSPIGAGETYSSPLTEPLKLGEMQTPGSGTPLSAHHELQLMREQLEQQSQQTQAAIAQVHLLRDQLAAENAARIEAQARNHQLLVHNKELLDHIAALVQHLQEQERQQGNKTINSLPQSLHDSGLPFDDRTFSLYPLGYPYPSPERYRSQQFYPSPILPYRMSPFGSPVLGSRMSVATTPGPADVADDQFIRPLLHTPEDKSPLSPGLQRKPRFDKLTSAMGTLQMGQDEVGKRPFPNGPIIQRSTSEKVPNRSELMSQVQRTAWARHTTK